MKRKDGSLDSSGQTQLRTPPRPVSRLLQARVNYGRRFRPLLIRRPIQWLLDGLCGSAAIFIAFYLRFDLLVPGYLHQRLFGWAFIMCIMTPVALSVRGGYRSTWQHFGILDLVRVAVRLFAFVGIIVLAIFLTPHGRQHIMPYSIAVIYLVLVLGFVSGVRLLRRLDHEAMSRLSATDRILVIGSARTIAGAARQLLPVYGDAIVGALCDDLELQQHTIGGVTVLGTTADLRTVLRDRNVSLLFLTSADPRRLPEVMETASELDIAVKLLPSVHDLMDNHVRISTTNVTPEALRNTEDLSAAALRPEVLRCLDDRIVLVTGAAGSIGSEIVRQVLGANLKRLILLDQDENGIFELLTELGKRDILATVIADIRDAEAIRSVFERERPHVVLHAAAYKHVPLMEGNPCEAVLNNVMGTRTLAQAAIDCRAERFVMISSDKAVHPSSVMGATKRLAEVVIQDLSTRRAAEGSTTQFACVRFGNVLGSRGSVLPLFLKQIQAGGPITVTHEQMTRYFMTIPQAVSLVLRAATLASCGHVYMLDMGDPVGIVDFAKQVIHHSGLVPGKDIEIRITGSRPGEKLHEQLWSEDAEVTPTAFDQVYEVRAEPVADDFPHQLADLERSARNHDTSAVIASLRRLPISYLSEQSNAIEPRAAA